MIELPAGVALNGAAPALMDFGGVMRPSLGARALKINRMGSRFRIACSLPPMLNKAQGRICVSRLVQAKREGLRLAYPLLGVDQSGAGTVVVNGAAQTGLGINLRGVTAGWIAKEGFWLSIVDATGQHYLHIVRSNSAAASAGGLLAVAIEPMLRVPFADGAVVNFTAPMIEGFVDGDEIGWQMSLAHHIGIEFAIEEAA
jgi:hypothetical protein